MAATKKHRGWGHIRRLPSGRYQASYIGRYDLVRHYAPHTYTVKEDAEAWLAGERRAIEQETWIAPALRRAEKTAKSIALGDYAATWIAQRKLSPRTREGYESKLRLHIEPTLGEVPISSLTPEMVRAWYAGLGDEHKTRNAHCYSLLHAICETAVEEDKLLAGNPCRIKGAMNAPTKRVPVVPTVEQLAALADAVPERFKALVLISAWCGLRWSEAVELRRRDFSDSYERLLVYRTANHRKGGCKIKEVKQGEAHKVTVPPHIRADIKHHVDTFLAKNHQALLFPPDRGGCHLNDKVFRESYLEAALKKVGLSDDMVFHDLKRFAATMASRAGATVAETMKRIGHRTVKAAMVYQAADEERDAEIAEALSEMAVAAVPPK